MKKKSILTAAAPATIASAGLFALTDTNQNEDLSDIQLANIEALNTYSNNTAHYE